MKAAFTVWNDRIAPLFDVARQVHLVESDQGRIVAQTRVSLDTQMPAYKARQLAEMGVETLVCGAISRSVQSMVAAYGIELVAFINGDLDAVIDAWQCGGLCSDAFLMPGCRRRGGWQFGQEPTTHNEEAPMNANQGGGQGRGGRGGGGRGGGQGRGRQNTGGPGAATSAMCVCPKCGHQEPHQRGVPCMNKTCAKCGAAMTRQ